MTSRIVKLARLIALQLLLVVVTLAGAELLLRLIAPTILLEPDEKNLFYRYDPELGWFPVANASGKFSGEIEYTVHQNSLGLRDDEYGDAKNGTIMFLGDSFVWGLDAEQDKRFTNILQRAFPDYRIVSAGVSGFGTDQEYLMLRRLWDRLNPTTVVLIFCSDNDRGDNSHNLAYQGYYKPYFAVGPRGAELHGLPIPISWRYYWKNEWFNRHFAVARLMTDLYIRLRHPRINVPDPTESLVTLIRQFCCGSRGAVRGRN